MSITEVLNSDKSPAEMLKFIQTIVQKVRKSYGNQDASIDVPNIPTCEGLKPLSMLSDVSKVATAAVEVQGITTIVFERSKQVQGLNTEKCAEALIATNAVLVNLGETVSFGVL